MLINIESTTIDIAMSSDKPLASELLHEYLKFRKQKLQLGISGKKQLFTLIHVVYTDIRILCACWMCVCVSGGGGMQCMYVEIFNMCSSVN